MDVQLIAALILMPFVAVFIYACIHEFLRYKSEGRANYGLVYDEETGASHVTGISEDEEAYNPEEFDPSDYNKRDIGNEADDETEVETKGETSDEKQ